MTFVAFLFRTIVDESLWWWRWWWVRGPVRSATCDNRERPEKSRSCGSSREKSRHSIPLHASNRRVISKALKLLTTAFNSSLFEFYVIVVPKRFLLSLELYSSKIPACYHSAPNFQIRASFRLHHISLSDFCSEISRRIYHSLFSKL